MLTATAMYAVTARGIETPFLTSSQAHYTAIASRDNIHHWTVTAKYAAIAPMAKSAMLTPITQYTATARGTECPIVTLMVL